MNNPYYVGDGHGLDQDMQTCIEISKEECAKIFECRVCDKIVCADCGFRKNYNIYCSSSHLLEHAKLCATCKCEIAKEEFDEEKGATFSGMKNAEGDFEPGVRYKCDKCQEFQCVNCIYHFGLDDYNFCASCNLYQWEKELGCY
jgi:hypothetical protein